MRPDLPKRQKKCSFGDLDTVKTFKKQSIVSRSQNCSQIQNFEIYDPTSQNVTKRCLLGARKPWKLPKNKVFCHKVHINQRIKSLTNMRSKCDPTSQNVKKRARLGARKPWQPKKTKTLWHKVHIAQRLKLWKICDRDATRPPKTSKTCFFGDHETLEILRKQRILSQSPC